jgi:hypothetical protein
LSEEEEGEVIAKLPILAGLRMGAFKDFVKEEYKKHIREVYEGDPELQKISARSKSLKVRLMSSIWSDVP